MNLHVKEEKCYFILAAQLISMMLTAKSYAHFDNSLVEIDGADKMESYSDLSFCNEESVTMADFLWRVRV